MKSYDITQGFLDLIEIPKKGLVIIINEESRKVFVTYSYNTAIILTRMIEKKRTKDYSKDVLMDLESRKARILVQEIDTEDDKDPEMAKDILRHLTNLKLDEYQKLGYTFYDNQYIPTKFLIRATLDAKYRYVVSLNTARRKIMVVKLFKDPHLAKEFINNTSILEMIRLHYKREY
jgi:hypothetical protein